MRSPRLLAGLSVLALVIAGCAKAKGVTLAYGDPADDGTYYWSDSYFIASQSPNPDTARAYISYMTSPEANAKVDSRNTHCALPNSAASG